MTQNIDTTETTTEQTTTATEETPVETTPETPAEKPAKTPKAPKEPKAPKAPKEPKAPKPPKEPKVKPVREVPAHLAKINKVAAQLPALSADASFLVDSANEMTTADICSAIAYLQIAVRRRGVTALADAPKLNVGDRVSVSSASNPRFIGQMGTVNKVQRIRAYVTLDNKDYSQKDGRPSGDYFFHTDLNLVQSIAPEAVTEEAATGT
jgi:type IV secretory pathway VirB10-like protein